MAIASIQSSATFPDPNVKYVFRAENGGQVKEGRCRRCHLGGQREVMEPVMWRPGLEDEVTMWAFGGWVWKRGRYGVGLL